MRAQISQKFRSGFELTEEGLLRLAEIASKRLQANGLTLPVKVDVKRADHALITYDNVSDCFAEDNGKVDRITGLRLYSNKELAQSDFFEVKFEKGEKTELSIISEDRDRALLALADAREYLKNEVVVRRFAFVEHIIAHRFFPAAFFAVIMFAMMAALSLKLKRSSIDPIKSDTTQEKIDYLYRSHANINQMNADGLGFTDVLVVPFALFLLGLLVFGSWKYLYLSDLFIWGKEKQRVEATRNVVSKIFWVVFVGAAASAIGGLVLRSLG